MFIVEELPKSLQPFHLPEALSWVEMQGPTHSMIQPFKRLADAIMTLGWKHIDYPGVLEAFAKAALSRIKHFDSLVEGRSDRSLDLQLRQDSGKRRRLLETLVVIHANTAEDVTEISYSQSPVVVS